jgi:hypothetical protein
MEIARAISGREQELIGLCRETGVRKLYAFGSSVRDDFRMETSDFDLVVEMSEADPVVRGGMLLALWDRLETFFRKPVDLVTMESLRNPVFIQEVNRTKVPLYDGVTQKVLV